MTEWRRRETAEEDESVANEAMLEAKPLVLKDEELYEYIGQMAMQLRSLTVHADMKFMTYLLEMVAHEAATAPRRTRH
jgi:N-acetylglutamate synthase-like GNAT family acetyltransferase